MTMKSLLLGAAAGIAAIGAAQAADLPMTKGEAVEYVKVCSTFGPGFFYIPGSDTCLKIGGEIRADYRAFGHSGDLAKFTRDDDRSAFNTQARIWFDARTQTDYGLLRSYFQIDADSHPIKGSPSADASDAAGRGTSNKFTIDKAFIQFGGLTAGYAHSFFGFYDNEYGDTIWGPYYADSDTVNLIAYTAQFGGGLNATLSIEDGRDHRANAFVAGQQGGQQIPDVVGQIRWDQDWGTLAAQGAYHQYRSAEAIVPRENKSGFAVGGDVLIKIPYIDGGHFIVEGQYADGATEYLGSGNTQFGSQDYFFTTGTTQFKAGKGWSIVGELGGNITPSLNANLVASYIDTKYDDAFVAGSNFGVSEATVTGNLTYTIVKGLTVAGEVSYIHEKLSKADGLTINGVTNTQPNLKENIWEAGIRLKRVF